MHLGDFKSQLETEFTWRSDEIRFFQNLCERLVVASQKNQFRRASILLLYSHFEGYCKFALSLYVSAVNDEGLVCSQVNSAIVAASLHDILVKLRDGSGKAPEFRNALPDDAKLHSFARDREFVERSAEIMSRRVKLPSEIVNTESNLKPVVLRKNLYRLGLPYEPFEEHEPLINKLLELRNKIAHGESKAGINKTDYDDLWSGVIKTMSNITRDITKAFDEKSFLVMNS